MAEFFNPTFREEPRNKLTAIIPARSQDYLLDWLESTGRLILRDPSEQEDRYRLSENEPLSEIMGDLDMHALEEEEEGDLEE
ncbi:MAG: DUF3134 family protein [Pseudanabaena sp. CRU_2_10]|nr:DUF3134 family protein [Pseudanabaena sp. CRU_2_10]